MPPSCFSMSLEFTHKPKSNQVEIMVAFFNFICIKCDKWDT